MPYRTDLIATFEQGRDTIRLLQPLVYWSPRLRQEIAVPTGFVCDGASIPRVPLLWSIIGHPFSHEYRESAVLHDFIYIHLVDAGLTKRQADQVFYDSLREQRVSYLKAKIMWVAVSLCGTADKTPDFLRRKS